ncbi:hypothetical protein BGW38_002608 [Lunasporangiospora selenospora]|uniref:IPT/TIG domain-containing protein n=1 Tax=Lunasporangiospora selenospora TaxID=979761 RepID=A0A9P6FTV1_9FUNG|nr:hypothetical protein BGW38_002608 [Lunasporangiospora selenospora]
MRGEAAKRWKQLRLPRPLIAKEKHRMEKFNGRDKSLPESDILTLEARLVCDHDMEKLLECCDNCIGRERKRAHRRKETQKLIPGGSSILASIPIFGAVKNAGTLSPEDESNPPTPTEPHEYLAWERSRIMVFSSTEYVDISSGQCLLPTRITCYCRHHNEKVGFRIQFTARDSAGAVLTSVLTNPVMMMDDHKSGKRAVPGAPKSSSASSCSGSKAVSATGKPRRRVSSGGSLNLNVRQEGRADELGRDSEDDDDDFSETDLEAGQQYSRTKREADEELSLDTTANGAPARVGTKRRVDDESSIASKRPPASLALNANRGPYRRKTSHDVPYTPVSSVPASPFFGPIDGFTPIKRESFSTSSPFVPGSPYANDEQPNIFSPHYVQAMSAMNGNIQNLSEFLNGGAMQNPKSGSTDAQTAKLFSEQQFLNSESVSLLESFTTLDESNSMDAFASPSYAPSLQSTSPGDGYESRTSFSVPSSAYSETASPMHSPFVPTFSPVALTPDAGAATAFFNAKPPQDFQTLQNQQQQQWLFPIQQAFQQQKLDASKLHIDTQQAVWAATNPSSAAYKEALQTMRNAVSLPTSPSSSAFIQIPTSIPDESETLDLSPPLMGEVEGTKSFAAKRRGQVRRSYSTAASTATSPMISPKAPSTNMPPSPSPPPFSALPPQLSDSMATTSSSSPSVTVAAQFLLYQQQQQQQHQHQLYQQMQSGRAPASQTQAQVQQPTSSCQQPQQKPRVNKLIPSRGPLDGGIEVTLLGTGFFPGMVPSFGGVPVTHCHYYGPETVICRLPQRVYAGTVVVKAHHTIETTSMNSVPIEGSLSTAATTPSPSAPSSPTLSLAGVNHSLEDDTNALFEYEEDKSDRDLMALALQTAATVAAKAALSRRESLVSPSPISAKHSIPSRGSFSGLSSSSVSVPSTLSPSTLIPIPLQSPNAMLSTTPIFPLTASQHHHQQANSILQLSSILQLQQQHQQQQQQQQQQHLQHQLQQLQHLQQQQLLQQSRRRSSSSSSSSSSVYPSFGQHLHPTSPTPLRDLESGLNHGAGMQRRWS